MQKYECMACGYIYDPELGDPDNGVEPGTAWEDVQRIGYIHYVNMPKDMFEPID